jgi:hypothetical protein
MSGLYRRVELDEPCQYVGCHPIWWLNRDEPTAAFVDAPEVEDEIEQLRASLVAANERVERAEAALRMGGRAVGSGAEDASARLDD